MESHEYSHDEFEESGDELDNYDHRNHDEGGYDYPNNYQQESHDFDQQEEEIRRYPSRNQRPRLNSDLFTHDSQRVSEFFYCVMIHHAKRKNVENFRRECSIDK